MRTRQSKGQRRSKPETVVGQIEALKSELSEVKVWLRKNYEYTQPKYDIEALRKVNSKKPIDEQAKEAQVSPPQLGLAAAARCCWIAGLQKVADLTELLIYRVELSGEDSSCAAVSALRFAFKRLIKSAEGTEAEPTKLVLMQRDADRLLALLETTRGHFAQTPKDNARAQAKKTKRRETGHTTTNAAQPGKPAETGRDIAHTEKERTKWRRIWRLVKKVPGWIYGLIGFLAALLTVFYRLGWLEPIKTYINRILP